MTSKCWDYFEILKVDHLEMEAPILNFKKILENFPAIETLRLKGRFSDNWKKYLYKWNNPNLRICELSPDKITNF